ncbi:MAG: VOC family protein [Gammaproteobacteria bacterium]|nr:VOC family protein [Gammaproteobacteria bacterium]
MHCLLPSPRAGASRALKTAISTDLGLLIGQSPGTAGDPEEQDAARERLEAAGIAVEMELDHGWCDSIYFADPNGILVELCCDRPGGMPVDEAEAERLLTAND